MLHREFGEDRSPLRAKIKHVSIEMPAPQPIHLFVPNSV